MHGSLALGILYFIVVASAGLWALLRGYLFLAERLDSVSVYPDLYLFASWLLRIVLVAVALSVAVMAVPGAIFAFQMGDAFGSGGTSWWAYISLISIGFYALGAVVMNLPFFPLRLHRKLIYPFQLVLLPCLVLLVSPMLLLMLLVVLLTYFLLWLLCLADRAKYGAMTVF